MTTRNDNREPRTIVRARGNRRRTQASPGPRHEPDRKPIESKAAPHGRDLQYRLADITRRLKVIGAVTVTVEVALRTQNCEHDIDVARCLRFGVVDALTTQIESLSRFCVPAVRQMP
jgi:hypothetical protein